ncbi:MAG: Rrf2 family transcriptional regulator [Alphaproteobacteria bacterium]
MKLQTASRLAIYAVLELASDPGRQLSAAEIAQKYGVSTHHLAKVLHGLRRAGLVHSVRGAGGGFRFAGNARRVTLRDIIALFEPLGEDRGGLDEPGENSDIGRALGRVLEEIGATAEATLRSVTVATCLKLAPPPRAAG